MSTLASGLAGCVYCPVNSDLFPHLHRELQYSSFAEVLNSTWVVVGIGINPAPSDLEHFVRKVLYPVVSAASIGDWDIPSLD